MRNKKHNNSGNLVLKSGKIMPYSIKRITKDLKHFVCYTDEGVKQIIRNGIKVPEEISPQNNNLEEEELFEKGYLKKIPVSRIKTIIN